MSSYKLDYWVFDSVVATGVTGQIDHRTFHPEDDFWLELVFYLAPVAGEYRDAQLTPCYSFLLCNPAGLSRYLAHNFFPEEREMTLKNVVVVHEYSSQRLLDYLATISAKCAELPDAELLSYLQARFETHFD